MATLEQIEAALRKADAAGNVDDARRLAAAYREMQSQLPEPQAETLPSGQTAQPPSGLKPGTREYADWAAQNARAGNKLPQVGEHQTTESNILDPFVQGVTFGWGDELRGVTQGALAAARGGDFGSAYDQVVDESRNALDRERQVNPIGSFAAEMAGAIPSGIGLGGQLAGKGATLATRVASTARVGFGQGAAYGAGAADGDLQDRAQSGFVGGTAGGVIGAAMPLAGNAISNFIQKSQQGAVLSAAAKAAPQSDELMSLSSKMFEQATGGKPIAISDNAYMRFLGEVSQLGKAFRINETLDPKAVGLSEMLMSIADETARGGAVIDLKDLHIIRQAAQKVAQSAEGRDAAFARNVISRFDKFATSLKPDDMLDAKSPDEAVNLLMKGISTWSRANRVSLIEEAIRKGQMAGAGPEKGIRNALRSSIFNKPDVWRQFSPAEQQAIKDVIQGTPGSNLMKLVGTFGFGGNTATNGIGGAAGMALGQMAGGPVGMVAGPVIGSIGRNVSEKMTENLANRALGAVATEGLKIIPRINPNQATPIEMLLRRTALPAAAPLLQTR